MQEFLGTIQLLRKRVAPNNLRHAVVNQSCVAQTPDNRRVRLDTSRPPLDMRPYRFYNDPIFIIGCIAYALNRWCFKPLIPLEFLHSYFNDLWLIPCALPPVLWLHSRLGLRPRDTPPSVSEVALHLVGWSIICEWIGPRLITHATADPMDILAYAIGGLVAVLWWSRDAVYADPHPLAPIRS